MALTVTLGEVASARLFDLPRAALPAAIHDSLAAQPRAGLGSGLALGAALALGALAASPAQAATITVDTFAFTLAVDGDCTLPEALDNANNNDATHADCAAGEAGLDTIVFDANLAPSTVTLGSTLSVLDELVLDGSNVATLDGYGSYRIIRSDAPLTVRNIDFVYGTAVAGGAIAAYENLTVENAFFYGNYSEFPGGAIIANEGLSVTDTDFVRNDAKYIGGGAVASFGDGSSFNNVYAYRNDTQYGVGGALLLRRGTHVVSGSRFVYNDATSGGAIAAGNVYGGGGLPEGKGMFGPVALSLSISDGSFEYNSTRSAGGPFPPPPQGKLAIGPDGGAGGAIAFVAPQYGYGLAHSLSITGGTSFTRNSALGGLVTRKGLPTPSGGPAYAPPGIGGAVFSAPTFPYAGQPEFAKGPVDDTVDILVEDASFTGNVALLGGGALLQGTTVTVRGSTFEANLGAYLGGGLWAGTKYLSGGPGSTEGLSQQVTVEDTSLLDNAAGGFAGGILFGQQASASGLNVRGNGAKYIGGNVPNGSPAKGIPYQVVDCQYGQNQVVAGLGVIGIDSASVSGGSIFAGNCGFGDIGGLLATSYSGTLDVAADTQVYGNSARFAAGMLAGAKYQASGTIGGRFVDNVAYADGGGLAILADGGSTVDVSGVTVSGNSAYGGGGGMTVSGSYAGGALAQVAVSGSTISGNSAGTGGGILVGAGLAGPAKSTGRGASGLRALASELGFVGRRAGAAQGGKGSSSQVDLSIVNTTIDGNSAGGTALRAKGFPGYGAGGGIALTGDANAVDLAFVTVSANSAANVGGGLATLGLFDGQISIRNSIFAENAAASADDAFANVIADFSLFGDATFAPVSGGNNQIGVDAQLEPLQDNGGTTLTRLPAATSPAINSADPAFAPPPDFDQRGDGFPRVVGGVADKGAVELPPPQVVSLVIDPDSFLEDAGSTMTVTLDRAAGVDVPVTVAFSGTAILDTDFASGDDDGVAAGVQVVVPAGSTSGSVALTGLDDAIDEPDEPFTATVTAAIGADLPASAVSDIGTVLDNDAATLSIGDVAVAEEVGSAIFAVNLSIPSASTVEVAFSSADGSATTPADYTAVNGTLTFDPGITSGQIVVPIIDDTLAESDETFSVTLSAPVNATISDASGTGTILDTDVAPTVGVGLSIGSVDEDGGTTQIIASLSAPSSQPVVITLAFGGNASFGVDYTVEDQDPGTPGIQIVIPPGATSGSVLLTAIGDQTDENDEQVVVTIASATGGVGVDPTPAAGTILDPASGPVPLPQPTIVPALSPWMLLLLGLILPAAVMRRLGGK